MHWSRSTHILIKCTGAVPPISQLDILHADVGKQAKMENKCDVTKDASFTMQAIYETHQKTFLFPAYLLFDSP